MDEQFQIRFGMPDEWNHFAESHKPFLEKFPNLKKSLEIAFIRVGQTDEPVDRVVFFLGRLCVEDFFEILLLCGNGYGIGAQKILRGMYERVVTARYLHLNPQETDKFLDFHWIQQRKLASAVQRTFGEDALPREMIEDLEDKYKRLKKQFEVTDCQRCGTKKLNYTWSKLDFVSMAAAAGSVGRLIVPGYYLPTREAHSTAGSVFSRLKALEEGGLGFDGEAQRDSAKSTLLTAHNLILNILELQKDHFKIERLEESLQVCIQDFMNIWKD